MTYLEYETFLRESTDYLRARIEGAKAQFGIGYLPRYEYDLFRGEIWWSEVGEPKIRGRVTVVGTISTKSNTWLWSWANPHFSNVILGDIDKVRKFGSAEAITKLTEEKWEAEEVDGWEMTAIAARLLEAEGAYRPPNDNGFLFLLYDRLERIPCGEIGPYMPLKRSETKITPNPLGQTKISRFLDRVRRSVRLRIGGGKDRAMDTWPFADPKNVAVFTVTDISKGRVPILRVCHDVDDGAWQFLTGSPLPEKKDWVLLALKEVVRLDPSIAELAGLPLGWEATRASVGEPWTKKPQTQ
jgi:hypothetical protein